MKLAFCLFKYFPYSGLSRDLLRVLKECNSRGHELDVYVSGWQGSRPEGVRIHILSVLPLANHTQNASFYNQFKQSVASKGFDAIIGFNKMPGLDIYYGADYCYIARVVPRYGHLYRLAPRFHHFYSYEKAVFDINSSTTVLSLSEREKGVYQQHYGTPENRFELLPPTLDIGWKLTCPSDQVRREKRAEFGVSSEENLLLFIGSGFKTKGLDRTIKAIASLSTELRGNTRLFVIGQDSEHSFQRLVLKLNLENHVRFMGGRNDILEIMTAGDLLIHPAYNENTGTVLIEAIVTGLPVLATDTCGFAPHITKANAGIVLRSPFEQKELNEKLQLMMCSENRKHWRKNGINYGANPDLYRMPQTVSDLIEQWVENKQQQVNHQTKEVNDAHIYIRRDIQTTIGEGPAFDRIMAIKGEVIRKVPGRRTVRFDINEKFFYLKTHTGVGWQEILKNLLYFRLPVLGAMNEWHGIHHLNRLGIKTLTVAGYGTVGSNPAKRRSFILTDEISNTVSLEELCGEWSTDPPKRPDEIKFKRWLITRTAQISRDIHNSGANHRDFYLCHFLIKREYINGRFDTEKSQLYIIDLHRMQIRKRTPTRWVIKDIAGLYFSSKDVGLSSRDLFRFMKVYRSVSLREALSNDQLFWKRVKSRGENLYQSEKLREQLRQAPAQGLADIN